jgi:hypothetical protein
MPPWPGTYAVSVFVVLAEPVKQESKPAPKATAKPAPEPEKTLSKKVGCGMTHAHSAIGMNTGCRVHTKLGWRSARLVLCSGMFDTPYSARTCLQLHQLPVHTKASMHPLNISALSRPLCAFLCVVRR